MISVSKEQLHQILDILDAGAIYIEEETDREVIIHVFKQKGVPFHDA